MDQSTALHSRVGASKSTLAFWALTFGGGAYLGYGIAYSLALSGLGQLGAVVAAVIAATILTTLGVIAVVAVLLPDKRGRPAARVATVAGLLLALGVGFGWAITPVLGLTYREPVLLEADGTLSLSLDGLDDYVGKGDAPASCRSELNGDTFPFVEADLVGKVGRGMVVASMSIPPDSSDGRPVVQVWVQPADKSKGVVPVWRGPADVVARIGADHGGQVVFTGAALTSSEVGGSLPEGWPAELSGTLTWSCGAWSNPGDYAGR